MTLPIAADGMGFDRALAALFFRARAGQTVSQMAALAARAGQPWGCRLCGLLARLVEPDHCELALQHDNGATTGAAAVRSGALLLVVALVLSLACWAGWAMTFMALRMYD